MTTDAAVGPEMRSPSLWERWAVLHNWLYLPKAFPIVFTFESPNVSNSEASISGAC